LLAQSQPAAPCQPQLGTAIIIATTAIIITTTIIAITPIILATTTITTTAGIATKSDEFSGRCNKRPSFSLTADVCFGSKAGMTLWNSDVRYSPKSGHWQTTVGSRKLHSKKSGIGRADVMSAPFAQQLD
jgi:hypothetical protein